jgi:hypothetical protein
MIRRFLITTAWISATLIHYAAWAGETITYPFQGVRHIHRTETTPRLLNIHIVEIDLRAPGVAFRLTPPNGDLPGETTSQTTLNYLIEQSAQVAINGDFYAYDPFPYTNLVHLGVSDGVPYSAFNGGEPAINLARNNVATRINRDTAFPPGYEMIPKVPLWNAIGGNEHIVSNGSNVATWNELHPRTALGYTADQKLLMATVDGRQPGHSLGMTTPELANLLISYGVREAINLDGGGSTTMAMNDRSPRLVNVPIGTSGQPGSQRRNGNSLALFARPAPPVVPPAALSHALRQTAVYNHVGAELQSGRPTNNYGTLNDIRVGGNPGVRGNLRGALAFDLSHIPTGSTIHSVSLTLNGNLVVGDGGTYLDFELFKLDGDVVETETTWNRASAGDDWSTPGGDFGGLSLSTLFGQDTTGVKEFVSTIAFVEAAQQALDQDQPLSMMLTALAAENLSSSWYMRFTSDDNSNLAQRPTLNIQYSVAIPEPASAVVLLFAAMMLMARRPAGAKDLITTCDHGFGSNNLCASSATAAWELLIFRDVKRLTSGHVNSQYRFHAVQC